MDNQLAEKCEALAAEVYRLRDVERENERLRARIADLEATLANWNAADDASWTQPMINTPVRGIGLGEMLQDEYAETRDPRGDVP